MGGEVQKPVPSREGLNDQALQIENVPSRRDDMGISSVGGTLRCPVAHCERWNIEKCRADRMMAHAIYGREHDRIGLLVQSFLRETFHSQNWHSQRIEP
ncbi:hypothetical protein CP97_13910 [Aurantiacibacter atlanticus]|uniref:Uncharacterized protein n=1 Tax=Aurantiacibacter atlanticus TaxID=1648404 RepID=A0A0H4VEW1_9SPHN|nr:hypothetical protein CP97_13910 [Aurantiacibacter atlanticus]